MTLNDVLKKKLEKATWKRLSEHYPWTEDLIRKFAHKLDWKALSENNHVVWTPELIEAFKDSWDWSVLSANENLIFDYELIDRYIDRWDWAKLINHDRCWWYQGANDLYGAEFLERYASRIPEEALEGSYLWEAVVGKHQYELLRHEILKRESIISNELE